MTGYCESPYTGILDRVKMYQAERQTDTPKSPLKTWPEFRAIYAKQGFENKVKIRKMYVEYLNSEKYLGNTPQEQKGIEPMCYAKNPNPFSSATTLSNVVTAPQAAPVSDIQIQRDYLLNRLERASSAKNYELQKLYNLFVGDNRPKTSQALIDAITGGKYTLDAKKAKKQENKLGYHYDEDEDEYFNADDAFFAFIWDGPKPDRDGYDAATVLKLAEYNKAKDQIMIGDPAAGLAAIQAFEAWLPAAKAN